MTIQIFGGFDQVAKGSKFGVDLLPEAMLDHTGLNGRVDDQNGLPRCLDDRPVRIVFGKPSQQNRKTSGKCGQRQIFGCDEDLQIKRNRHASKGATDKVQRLGGFVLAAVLLTR